MPHKTEWVSADEYSRATGPSGEVVIYHTYREDEYDSPRAYLFTTDPEGQEDDDTHAFDIRELVYDGQPTEPTTPPALTTDNFPTYEERADHDHGYSVNYVLDRESPEYKAGQAAWAQYQAARDAYYAELLAGAITTGAITPLTR